MKTKSDVLAVPMRLCSGYLRVEQCVEVCFSAQRKVRRFAIGITSMATFNSYSLLRQYCCCACMAESLLVPITLGDCKGL